MSLEELVRLRVSELDELYRARSAAVEARVRLPLALRLDGVGFGGALSGYSRPRDAAVHRALLEGAAELLHRLSASCAYVVSDEVNLLLLGPHLPYGGRVEKLVSVSAALLSARVSLLLGRCLIFDSRVVPLEGVEDARRYVLYRARVGLNNYVGSLLHAAGARVPEGSKLERQIELLEQLGVRLASRPVWEWGGTSVYWALQGGRRVVAMAEGPWRLLEEVERYRSPEAEQRLKGSE